MKLLGLFGVLVCVAAAVVVWFVGARLSHVNETVFAGVDRSLSASRDRVLDAQKRVQDSKITTDDVRQGVEHWMRQEATEHVAARLEVEQKAERLASGLDQADRWLEVSGASLQGVQGALQMVGSGRASADGANVDALMERLGAVRGQLKEATETVGAIRERMASALKGETLEERIRRIAQLAVRVMATLGEIDSNLGQFADRLVITRTKGQDLQRRVHVYIVAAQAGAVLLIAWMAAGQVSLWRRGWRG